VPSGKTIAPGGFAQGDLKFEPVARQP